MEKLPNEVILQIFSYLDMKDLALSAQHVDCHWKQLSQDKQLWKNKVFEPDDRMLDDERVHLLKNMPSLRAYKSLRGRDTELIIDTLCTYCKDIEHIHLNASHKFKYYLLQKVTQCFPNIEKLVIPYLKEENPLQFSLLISGLEKLTTLSFTDRYALVPDGILKPIADMCPSLQHMDLGDNIFRDEDIRYFLIKKQMQLLSFGLECPISKQTYNCIIACKNLEGLRYDIFNHTSALSADNIKSLRNLKNLKSLRLKYLTEAQFRAVPSIFEGGCLCNVIKLHFRAYDLSSVIKNCPQLLELSVDGTTQVLEEGFKNIGNCKRLKFLSLEGSSQVTPKCLEYVAAGCPNLEHLDLSCSNMNDTLIPSVLKCKNLRVLDISYSDFSLSDFHLIPSHLIHLREFVIYECGVDDEVWDKLLEMMPHLKLTGRYFYEDDE